MKYVTGALAIVLLIVVAIVGVQNRAAVDVSFLFWTTSQPTILLILVSFVLGMLSGWGIVELVKRAF
jgi:putative membrane protein